MSLTNRTSKFYEVLLVYAVGAAILYTWALINTMNDYAKNWSLYLTIGEALVETAYIMLGVFLESVLVFGVLFAARYLLPARMLTGRFVMYGALLVAAFLGWLMFRPELVIGLGSSSAKIWQSIIVGMMLLLIVLGERFAIVRSGIEAFADRCVVLLYIYLPLSLLALIVVVIRNLG